MGTGTLFDQTEKVAANPALAERLEKMAGSLASRIEGLRADRLSNTPKRQCQAMAARCEANNLERVQRALIALSQGWGRGTVPADLADLCTRTAIEPLVTRLIAHPSYYVVVETDKWRDDSERAQSLRAFIAQSAGRYAEQDAEAQRLERVRRLEEEIRFVPIAGFFPTPPALIAAMLEEADIPDMPTTRVLEPSAGKGDIVEAIRAAAPTCTIHYCEIVPRLADLVYAKTGITHSGHDFMAHEGKGYHRVLMNPPFENGQDMEHVRRAFDMLCPGGRLVAIISAAFKMNRGAAFRDWMERSGAYVRENDADAFKGAFRATGVQTCLLVVDRP